MESLTYRQNKLYVSIMLCLTKWLPIGLMVNNSDPTKMEQWIKQMMDGGKQVSQQWSESYNHGEQPRMIYMVMDQSCRYLA